MIPFRSSKSTVSSCPDCAAQYKGVLRVTPQNNAARDHLLPTFPSHPACSYQPLLQQQPARPLFVPLPRSAASRGPGVAWKSYALTWATLPTCSSSSAQVPLWESVRRALSTDGALLRGYYYMAETTYPQTRRTQLLVSLLLACSPPRLAQ